MHRVVTQKREADKLVSSELQQILMHDMLKIVRAFLEDAHRPVPMSSLLLQLWLIFGMACFGLMLCLLIMLLSCVACFVSLFSFGLSAILSPHHMCCLSLVV
jgi:hypothetical protein